MPMVSSLPTTARSILLPFTNVHWHWRGRRAPPARPSRSSAWCRDTRRSSSTSVLSGARPMLNAPTTATAEVGGCQRGQGFRDPPRRIQGLDARGHRLGRNRGSSVGDRENYAPERRQGELRDPPSDQDTFHPLTVHKRAVATFRVPQVSIPCDGLFDDEMVTRDTRGNQARERCRSHRHGQR